MSQTILRGEIGYRTTAMLPEAAQAFARCITANATRFCNVQLCVSLNTKVEKLFVRFQPVSADRQETIRHEQQEARAERALEQPFMFWKDPDNRMMTWCFSVSSGETYQVTPRDCTCPDFIYRCKDAGIKCKHMIAQRLWSSEQMARMIAQDF